MQTQSTTIAVQFQRPCLAVVTRAITVLVAILVLVALTADTASAFKSKEKTPEEQAAENQKKAVREYNDGVKHMEKARAIGVKGDSAYAYNYRATSDAKARKEYEKAAENFRAAVALDSMMAEAYNNLGYCYRKLGKLEESLAAYDRALQIKPDFEQAREYRGETFLALGLLDKARSECDFLKQAQSPFADTLGRAIEAYQLRQMQGATTK